MWIAKISQSAAVEAQLGWGAKLKEAVKPRIDTRLHDADEEDKAKGIILRRHKVSLSIHRAARNWTI